MGIYRHFFVFTILLSLFWTTTARTQKESVPLDIQAAMLLKILSFDRSLETRVGDELVLCVLYQSRFERSLYTKERLESLIENSTSREISGIPYRLEVIDISRSNLATEISRLKVDILYVAPLMSAELAEISRTCREEKISTFAGVSEYVEAGLAVGFEIEAGKTRIIINRTAAQAEGAEFSSQLLKLAKVIE